MKTLIVQTSPMHTGSTFLVNALQGLFTLLTNEPIMYQEKLDNVEKFYKHDIYVFKTHDMDIDNMIKKYGEQYDLYFVCSERKTKKLFIDDKYKTYNNVIIFDYDEINETNDNPLSLIIDNLYNKISSKISNFELDKEKSYQRIINMNNKYEEIKDKPFSYVDKFYEIHGHHRNRK